MISSGVTYQIGIARIYDLRREADDRRQADLASPESGRWASMSRRGERAQRGRALAMLTPRRAARA
jgi:hypothetical protein